CSKEVLNPLKLLGRNLIEHAESKRLRHWRVDAVKHRIGTADVDPFGPNVWKGASASFNEACIGSALRPLQATGQVNIRKDLRVVRHDRGSRSINLSPSSAKFA